LRGEGPGREQGVGEKKGMTSGGRGKVAQTKDSTSLGEKKKKRITSTRKPNRGGATSGREKKG